MKYMLLGAAFLFAVPAYAYDASVSASASATVCTMEYAPVCGYKIAANNQCVGDACKVYATYGNQCLMNGDGAKFAHQGECTAKELGNDGETDGPAAPPKAYAPPAGCIAWYDGCNSCSQGACTLRACLRYEPGYCTKWSDAPMPVEPDGGIGNTPPAPPVAGEVSADGQASAGDTQVGFFARIWARILSWF